MPPGHIVSHLTRLLEAEAVPFEPGALRHIAKAASGSMRDSLSLLDQAIAHGAGRVEEQAVQDMLGTVGDDHLYAVLQSLQDNDVQALMAAADGMEARSLSFDSALQSLAGLLHRIALLQLAPSALSDEFEAARLAPYAEAFDPEFLQLAYQIVIHGREELPLAPDEATGFSMTLLRLFAFRPEQPAALGSVMSGGGGEGQARVIPPPRPPSASLAPREVVPARAAPSAPAAVEKSSSLPELALPSAPVPAASPVAPPPPASQPFEPASASTPEQGSSVPPWEDLPPEAHELPSVRPTPVVSPIVEARAPVQVEPVAQPPKPAPSPVVEETPAAMEDALPNSVDWHAVQEQVGLGGFNLQLAQHSELLGVADNCFRLRLASDQRHLLQINKNGAEKLQEALSNHYGRPVRVSIEVGEIATETPAQRNQAEKAERHAAALAALEQDPFVRELIERFDATLETASVKPL